MNAKGLTDQYIELRSEQDLIKKLLDSFTELLIFKMQKAGITEVQHAAGKVTLVTEADNPAIHFTPKVLGVIKTLTKEDYLNSLEGEIK